MSIFPLEVFEADADPTRRNAETLEEQLAKITPPKTMVVKFGIVKMIGEFPTDENIVAGCGSKLIARTQRGTEIVEMLASTCENAGCSKSISRQEMLEYIENSGGQKFPFQTNGRILRIANESDLKQQKNIEQKRYLKTKDVQKKSKEIGLDFKIIDVEEILGGQTLTIYIQSEQWKDAQPLVNEIKKDYSGKITIVTVGPREEARLVADYEKCGQHCCCKNFLKVLKPVSMGSAKLQRHTLDPLTISGRCGRLMCCLRYEDKTYKELKKNLPHRKTRVGTPEGTGIVIDSKVLVQLVLVKLDSNGQEVAIPVEDLSDPNECEKINESNIEGKIITRKNSNTKGNFKRK